MHKTRNLFRAKTAQKGFRVSVFARFLCASCYRVFVLQQPRVFLFIPRSAGGSKHARKLYGLAGNCTATSKSSPFGGAGREAV